MPWRGPLGGDPLETLPGPSNPWLACDGSGNDRTGKPGENDPKLPDFPVPDEGSVGIDWKKIGVGVGMVVAGVLVIVAAIVGALAVAATLPATATGAAAAVVVAIVGSMLAAGGSILMGAGGATVIGGIDPKISDYKKHVPAVPMRKLALPGDLPPAVATFMQSVAEIERLSTAETDIIDHARAAAKANDKSWTELHLRDLWHVQNAKQHFVGTLSGALREINAAFGQDFDQHHVDPQEPVRDLINPLIEMRATLNEVASISSAEVNGILATVRVPSPMSEAIDTSVRKFATQAKGQPSEMVNIAADQLECLDVIDHEAFGRKP
ncbi:hypothetical protein [uncultured Erythrobacter sp.]|uniref:hypothetical protein n=1 Tax=uncultured Erythrobacter sp. TaxID=263913 RepID=UPI00260B6824|nr:hypothetical protein [uncultured Erythrobacter sp.]